MALHKLEVLSNLHEGYRKSFIVGGHKLLLLKYQDQISLIENRCPHMDVELSNADFTAENGLRCKAHGIEFDLQSGKARGPLANTLDCLKKFSLVYEGNYIAVEL
jgi:nitrite reductase/ring-hydroxylating ferredoxin subunit